MRFSPLDKPLHEVDADDLSGLADFCEQMHVEYKGPGKWGHSSDIAKSIASFANARGGWLFIGLDADDDNRPRVGTGEITGVSKERAQPEETLYQLASAHLSPRPHFVVRVIDIRDTHFVAAIAVPESHSPPHIHVRSGTVPVRDGNTTLPVRVTDRSEMDALYQKAEVNRAAVDQLALRHQGGVNLAQYVYGNSQRRVRDVGDRYFSCVYYPLLRVEDMFPYVIDINFPRCDWPGREVPALGESQAWRLPPCRFTSNGVQVCSAPRQGYYIDCSGHVCYARIMQAYGDYPQATQGYWDSDGGPASFVRDTALATQELYNAAGYHGEIGFQYATGRTWVREAEGHRISCVASIVEDCTTGITEEIERQIGYWNRESPNER